jgi:HSP20 family molecular chaperone IbpA
MNASAYLAVQFRENARFIRLSVDLPGVLNRDLSVELQRGVLIIRGTRATELARGVCHQHKFCRRFALDTDVVDSSKLKANLNRQGVLTVMAPKKSRPTTLLISITEQQDDDFERSVVESYVPQKQQQQQHQRQQHGQMDSAENGKRGNTIDGEDDEEGMGENEQEGENASQSDCLPEVEYAKKAAADLGKSVREECVSEVPKKRFSMLPNVVGMESASAILPARAVGSRARQGSPKSRSPIPSSLQSHLMIRRSQSNKPTNAS